MSSSLTASDARIIRRIHAVAHHMCGDARAAHDRGWIDADGRPTRDGLHLASALEEQSHTRTVLRGL